MLLSDGIVDFIEVGGVDGHELSIIEIFIDSWSGERKPLNLVEELHC